jgi:hypothetical protein
MADQEEFVTTVSQFVVEVSSHSHLVFSSLKQFKEVVFWERPIIPDIEFSDTDLFVALQVHDRIDNLASISYQDPLLWWFLAAANEIRLPPLQMNPGQRFRFPASATLTKILRSSIGQRP